MKFQCNTNHSLGNRSWSGEIQLLRQTLSIKEAVITSRGTRFHVITGNYQYGNFLCVPNMDFGCELSYLSDTFWNRERIAKHLDNPYDVESLVCGIKALGSLDSII